MWIQAGFLFDGGAEWGVLEVKRLWDSGVTLGSLFFIDISGDVR
jgi:hypothetical protein